MSVCVVMRSIDVSGDEVGSVAMLTMYWDAMGGGGVPRGTRLCTCPCMGTPVWVPLHGWG
jgi:hypothetical protein